MENFLKRVWCDTHNFKKIKEKEKDLYGIICSVSTEYKYSYENQKDKENAFRIGTYHYLNVKIIDNQ